MARCDIGHDSKTFGREVRHSWSNPASRGPRRAASRGNAASEQAPIRGLLGARVLEIDGKVRAFVSGPAEQTEV